MVESLAKVTFMTLKRHPIGSLQSLILQAFTANRTILVIDIT